jgi:hypothetical protein
MIGEVPAILWYLLGVVAFAVFPLAMVVTIHRHRMKVLEILRYHAEKGQEPPPAVLELLTKQISEPEHKWKSTPRGARLQSFMMFAFIACIAGTVAWWRMDAGGPPVVIYVMVGAAVFWGVSALGFLVAAVASTEK